MLTMTLRRRRPSPYAASSPAGGGGNVTPLPMNPDVPAGAPIAPTYGGGAAPRGGSGGGGDLVGAIPQVPVTTANPTPFRLSLNAERARDAVKAANFAA